MAAGNNQPIRVRVNRSFVLEGKVRAVGEEVTIPPSLAAELDHAGKIERSDREPSMAHREALMAAKLKADRKAGAGKAAKALA